MIERQLFAPYLDSALEAVRMLTFIVHDRWELAPDWSKYQRANNIEVVHVQDKVIVKVAPGIRKCPTAGTIQTTTLHLAKNVSKNYALLQFFAWHLYVQDNPQPEDIVLSGEMSELTKRLKKHLGLTQAEVVESALLGKTIQKRNHFVQFSQRMNEIIAISYIHGVLTMGYETNYSVKIALAQTVVEGLPGLKGRRVQELIEAPFMAESKGRIVHAAGDDKGFEARIEEDPIIGDLWNGKRTTRHPLAIRIWQHLAETERMLAA